MLTDETGITRQFVGRLAHGHAALGRDQRTVIEMGART